MDEQQPEQEVEKTKSKMHNEGSQKSQSQREGEEVTREKKKKKRGKVKIKRFFALKNARNLKRFSPETRPPQPIKIKHVATTCAMPPLSNQCKAEPQAP